MSRVLIVEDNPANMTLAVFLLKSAGYTVITATDAEAATAGGDAPTYELAYLVVSVRAAGVDDRKLFVWDVTFKSFVEAPFTIDLT